MTQRRPLYVLTLRALRAVPAAVRLRRVLKALLRAERQQLIDHVKHPALGRREHTLNVLPKGQDHC